MAKQEPADSVIYDVAHLPPGFVPLGKLCNESGATPLYGYIDRVFKRGELTHGRFRCRGKLFIHEEDLKRCREDFENRSEKQPPQHNTRGKQCSNEQVEAAVIALCEINNGITLMHGLLERLACAVEAIATQPKKDDFAEFTNN